MHAAQMAGVEIHANVVRTLLEGKGIGRSRPEVVLGLIGLLGTVCCFTVILAPRGELGVIVAIIMLFSMVIGAALLLFFYENYWLDVVPLLSCLERTFCDGHCLPTLLSGSAKRPTSFNVFSFSFADSCR